VLKAPLMFLFDVDNTLLDNDRFTADLTAWLDQAFGTAERERYWAIYAAGREKSGYADYLGALQAFRAGSSAQPQLQATAQFLLEYPFERLLYPDALAAVRHLAALAPVTIVSDGDMVFQPHKIHRSGLAAAFSDRVLVYVHKQESLDDLQARFSASHYVMIDDKPRLLAAMKQVLGARLTTIFVRQGHYASEPAAAGVLPAPDRAIDRIADLIGLSLADFPAAAPAHSDPVTDLP
jgi:FMN phosphatase YigB (HAD superfamily)